MFEKKGLFETLKTYTVYTAFCVINSSDNFQGFKMKFCMLCRFCVINSYNFHGCIMILCRYVAILMNIRVKEIGAKNLFFDKIPAFKTAIFHCHLPPCESGHSSYFSIVLTFYYQLSSPV